MAQIPPVVASANRIAPRSPRLQWSLLLLAGLILAGCGSPALPDWAQIPLPWRAEDTSTVPDEPLTLLVWYEDAQTDILHRLLDEFEAQHPETSVELIIAEEYTSDLQRRIAEDDLPDLLLVDSFRFPDLVVDGVLAPRKDGSIRSTISTLSLCRHFSATRNSTACRGNFARWR
ncbi:MAG: hypothetical protein R2873_31520 [Caldilineaceae bacterium]